MYHEGQKVERYMPDQPDLPPTPCVVRKVEENDVYVVGDSFGMWIPISGGVVRIRPTIPEQRTCHN